MRESPVKDTPTASATGLTTEVFIPRQYKLFLVIFNHLAHLRQLVAPKCPRLGQFHRLQPKLGIFLRAFDMNVRRLMALSAEKEKPNTASRKTSGICQSVSLRADPTSVEVASDSA